MNLKAKDYTPVDFTKFKTQFSAADISKVIKRPGGLFTLPIVTLSPVRTIGQGSQTYITLNNATDFEPGATPQPYAKFGQRTGYVEMHFEPSAYGITSQVDYVMEFSIVSDGNTTFTLHAYTGPVSIKDSSFTADRSGGIAQIIMPSIPSQVIYGTLTYASGDAWSWYFGSMQRG